jgi:hypothetical protein
MECLCINWFWHTSEYVIFKMKTIQVQYHILFLTLVILFQAACKKNETSNPVPSIEFNWVLKNVKPDHPRLLLTDDRLKELKTLSQTDNQLYTYVNAVFSSGSAEQVAPQKQNLGVSRLFAKTPSTSGNVTVAVLLSPNWSGVESSYLPVNKALSDW